MDLVSSVLSQNIRTQLTKSRFVIANLLALAAVCPFVGSVSMRRLLLTSTCIGLTDKSNSFLI